nr:hypothetical protein CFP56_10159 [Quercus suber]
MLSTVMKYPASSPQKSTCVLAERTDPDSTQLRPELSKREREKEEESRRNIPICKSGTARYADLTDLATRDEEMAVVIKVRYEECCDCVCVYLWIFVK